jgi:hypothetical protein
MLCLAHTNPRPDLHQEWQSTVQVLHGELKESAKIAWSGTRVAARGLLERRYALLTCCVAVLAISQA